MRKLIKKNLKQSQKKMSHKSDISDSLPYLSIGDRFAVIGNGYIRWATMVGVDPNINVSPLVDKYFYVKFEKDEGDGY
jgi:hypothetical protein